MSKQPVSVLTSRPDEEPAEQSSGAALACCAPLAARARSTEQAAAVAPLFKALGDPVRLRLMSMIASSAKACVCDLTDAFDVSGPTISHHLKVLREAGLVDCERRGTWVYYWVRPQALESLGTLLGAAGGAAG
ncbi:MAG: helix-turn-helix transcriptional regulator [Actinobacteria bacterium]|nr:helix-turn-helix transcriptional regulator [Actinomycetota bacterium]